MSKKDDSGGHFLFSAKGTKDKDKEIEKTKVPQYDPTKVGAGSLGPFKTTQDLTADKDIMEIIKVRGYQKRSFNNYLGKCNDLLKSLEANPDKKNVRFLLVDNFSKFRTAYQHLESTQGKLMSLLSEDSDDYNQEADYLTDIFTNYTLIETKMSESDIDLEVSFTEKTKEKTAIGATKLGPSSRFEIEPEKPLEDEAKMFFKAFAVNYKASEHVEKFDGLDPLKYIAFRHQWVAAEKMLLRQDFTPFERFLELRKTLKGQPLRLIEHLPNTDNSLETALTILDNMYLDPTLAITQVNKKLTELPKQGTTISSIKEFYTAVLTLHHSMMSLNLDEDYMGISFFIASIQSKLNGATLREWVKLTIRRKSDNPLGHDCTIGDMLDLIKFNLQINESFGSLQNVGSAPNQQDKNKPKYYQNKTNTLPKNFFVQQGPDRSIGQKNLQNSPNNGPRDIPFGPKSFNGQGTVRSPCSICDKIGHSPTACFELRGKSPIQKFNLVVEKKLCKLCLLSNHKTADCKKKEQFKCRQCNKGHNTHLHLGQRPPNQQKAARLVMRSKLEGINISELTPIAHLLKAHISSGEINAPYEEIIVLMDSGSSLNLITSDMVRKLQLPTVNIRGPRSCELVSGIKKVLCQRIVRFQLNSLVNDYQCSMQASVVNDIGTEEIPLLFNETHYPYLASHELTFKLPRPPGQRISLLIGEPAFSALFLGIVERCPCDRNEECVTVYNSKLGKYLGGAYEKRGQHFLRRVQNIQRES